jgi:hypothetical protein
MFHLHCTFVVDPGFGGILCQKLAEEVEWKWTVDFKLLARNEI